MDVSSLTVGKQRLTGKNRTHSIISKLIHSKALHNRKCRKKEGQLRDSSGQRLKSRDCPARIGTVGNYVFVIIN